MKCTSIAAMIMIPLLLLAGCGGGGGSSTDTTQPVMKGYWKGTTGAITTSAIVLANGDAWLVFQESDVITRFARLQVAASGTRFTSSSGNQYLLQSGTVETAAATGTFAEKLTLSGTMTATNPLATPLNLSYNGLYGTPATQAAAVGVWTGSFGGNSTDRTMTVTATGVLTGISSPGCSYSGSLLVRPADTAVFDVRVTETCGVNTREVTESELFGIATVNATGNAGETALFMAVTTADKASGALFMGLKL